MTRTELIARVKETAYLEGDFVLRSGRRSTYYLDKYRFETQPDILRCLGEAFAAYKTAETTMIAGAELGGVPLAAATSMATSLPFVIVRNAKKGYGTEKLFEGVLEKGDRVLLVEDVATTGGQVIEAARNLQEAGAVVERIVAVVDRLEGARENVEGAGFNFASLMTTEDLGVKRGE
jgi:orotate phosphoribosyltransferase